MQWVGCSTGGQRAALDGVAVRAARLEPAGQPTGNCWIWVDTHLPSKPGGVGWVWLRQRKTDL
jgi:hypothetical protein